MLWVIDIHSPVAGLERSPPSDVCHAEQAGDADRGFSPHGATVQLENPVRAVNSAWEKESWALQM